jgi:hypothetical protein
MKHILALAIFITASLMSEAQEFIEVLASPNFSYRILSSDDSHLKDSLDGADQMRKSVGFGIGASFNLNKSITLNTGFRYNDYGFTRIWEDLQFLDLVHPEIGRIEDLSQAAQKDAYFFHKFRYLEIPVRFNFQVSKKRKQQNFRIYLHAGLVNQIFLEENLKVFFKGFSVGGERTYKRISTGYNMKSFNVSAVAGGRFILRISPDYWLTAQPEINIPFSNHNTGDASAFRLVQLSGNFGIAKILP